MSGKVDIIIGSKTTINPSKLKKAEFDKLVPRLKRLYLSIHGRKFLNVE
jgi:hypothetical protein